MSNLKYKILGFVVLATLLILTAVPPAIATAFFSTGSPDGKIATASRPASAAKIEIESADDFVLATPMNITSATFTGLLTGGASAADIGQVVVEIYRVFPNDSTVARTSGAPTFSTAQVPTRVNSPADVAFVTRDSSASGELSFLTTTLSSSFTALNSVLDGINPKPNQTNGGAGAVTGLEVLFDVTFNTPISLAADHYFFIPEVQVTTSTGEFYWLSAPRPISGGTGPFSPDLQSWIRNENLDPDWLRVGTDIVGGAPPPTYNASFSLVGQSIPESSTMLLLGLGLIMLAAVRRRLT